MGRFYVERGLDMFFVSGFNLDLTRCLGFNNAFFSAYADKILIFRRSL
jgi:hypothetical protein